MTEYNKTPTYNLSAVLQETGLKADLLRAWERRYNLPKPGRTQGGHRLYSPYDIEVIKWLMARQAEGLSISRAVDLWESHIDNDRDPLIQHSPEKPVIPVEAGQNTITGITQLRADWIKACLDFNSVRSEEVLNQAFALHPVETVCVEILQRGLHEIGQGWYQDRVSAQQEHFASSLASRRLQTLISMTPPPNRSQTVLLGCPPGELHTLPVTQLDLFLRRRGIRVINLGADIPIDQMVATVLQLQPDLIIMAAQTLRTAANLQNTFIALLASGKHLAYGGLIFNRIPELRRNIPAYFMGENLDAALQVAEQNLRLPPHARAVGQQHAIACGAVVIGCREPLQVQPPDAARCQDGGAMLDLDGNATCLLHRGHKIAHEPPRGENLAAQVNCDPHIAFHPIDQLQQHQRVLVHLSPLSRPVRAPN